MLLVSVACFGFWIITFKLQRGAWRFELFAIDFALGAFLFAVGAALTVGNAGTDLPFSDRMVVSSKTAQALAFAGGCMFGVGNTLLLGAVSLLGVAAAFGMSGGLALALGLALRYTLSPVSLLLAMGLFLIAAILAASSCRTIEAYIAPVKGAKPGPIRLRRSTRGIIVAVLGAIAMTFSVPLVLRGAFDDFGLGPYAGLFIYCLGALIINLVFSLYFFNIALDGGAIHLTSYLRDWPRKHAWGILGGGIWALGGLTVLLERSSIAPDQPSSSLSYLPLAAVACGMTIGLLIWREFRNAPRAGAFLIFASLALIGLGTAALIFG